MLDNFQYRFWNKVKFSDGCWEWDGCVSKKGYGVINRNGKAANAHRICYELMFENPRGLYVCHRCDNRKCVNPAHLFLGTAKQNTDDMIKKGRQAREFKQPGCKLSNQDVLEIRKTNGISNYEIAKKYSVSRELIRDIKLLKKRVF